MTNKDLSIVIPSYLEEENLKVILPSIVNVLKKINIEFEILVIDTQEAKDNTKKICEENYVVYINRTGGNNYGDAVRTGIKQAGGKYVIFMDADGSHDPGFIKNLYENRGDFDVVVASRYVEEGDTENSQILIFMSFVVNAMYSLVLNIKCKDISYSFKNYVAVDLTEFKLK